MPFDILGIIKPIVESVDDVKMEIPVLALSLKSSILGSTSFKFFWKWKSN